MVKDGKQKQAYYSTDWRSKQVCDGGHFQLVVVDTHIRDKPSKKEASISANPYFFDSPMYRFEYYSLNTPPKSMHALLRWSLTFRVLLKAEISALPLHSIASALLLAILYWVA